MLYVLHHALKVKKKLKLTAVTSGAGGGESSLSVSDDTWPIPGERLRPSIFTELTFSVKVEVKVISVDDSIQDEVHSISFSMFRLQKLL